MCIVINGEKIHIETPISLEELLKQKTLLSPWKAAAVNGRFIPKKNYKTLTIHSGDCIEVLQPAQGG